MIKRIKYLIIAVFLLKGITGVAQQKSDFKVPPYTKFTLANGLTVYLMEQHEVPIISLSAIMPAGAIYDGEKAGLASLTADGLLFGTKSFTKKQIEEELDFVGAELNTYSAKEFAGLNAVFTTKDQDKVLGIIKEVLVDPVFNKDEFLKHQKRTLTNLGQEKESPGNVINAYWDKFIYGQHVYGNVVNGSPATVNKLTVNDLSGFYKTNYAPNGSAISIVGDFNAKVLKSKLERLFSQWKKVNQVTKSLASEPLNPLNSTRILLVNKEDANETTFLIGGNGIRRDNSDYVAITVINTVLGGRFTSLLNDELRVNSGLTYGARSSFTPLKNAGTFSISTFTANKNTEKAIDKALEVYTKFQKEGFDEQMLISAKNYVKGLFPPRYETSGQLAGLLTQMFWYGFNESYINNFQANVDGLTNAKVKEITAKYFPKENLQFVLIGKSAEIRKIAEKYGKVVDKNIKDDGY
jgi:predicted Zn-dependent peptidase